MKTAILTGASSGLGIQFARQLKRVFPEVEELWLIARRQDRLEALAAELTDLKTVVLPWISAGRRASPPCGRSWRRSSRRWSCS